MDISPLPPVLDICKSLGIFPPNCKMSPVENTFSKSHAFKDFGRIFRKCAISARPNCWQTMANGKYLQCEEMRTISPACWSQNKKIQTYTIQLLMITHLVAGVKTSIVPSATYSCPSKKQTQTFYPPDNTTCLTEGQPRKRANIMDSLNTTNSRLKTFAWNHNPNSNSYLTHIVSENPYNLLRFIPLQFVSHTNCFNLYL